MNNCLLFKKKRGRGSSGAPTESVDKKFIERRPLRDVVDVKQVTLSQTAQLSAHVEIVALRQTGNLLLLNYLILKIQQQQLLNVGYRV